MHYYEKNLGDYAKKTIHLTALEHGVYNLLIDHYYSTEAPIRDEDAHRIALARGDEDRRAVDYVLRHFFAFDELTRHWVHDRCEEEIRGYRAKSKKAQSAARVRWERERANAREAADRSMRPQSERNANAYETDADASNNDQISRSNDLDRIRSLTSENHANARNSDANASESDANASSEQCNARARPINQSPVIPPLPPKRGKVAQFPPGFDRFWVAYPKKVAKDAAAKAFAKAKIDEALLDVVLRAVAEHRASPQWTKDRGQYIPNPATWLNQRRWEDELELGGTPGDPFAGNL